MSETGLAGAARGASEPIPQPAAPEEAGDSGASAHGWNLDLDASIDAPTGADLPIGDLYDEVDLWPVHDDSVPPAAGPQPGTAPTRWGTRRLVEAVTTFAVVLFVTAFVVSQLQPGDIFSSAVPTGGDMGAHVWAPAYLRDHLLPHGRLSGWSMDWYGGLPTYRFYMLPPALLILLLDTVLPYGTAFKIIAVLGVVTLPLCLWAFGRMARLPYPIPALFAVAGAIYLFDETFTILGGNIASTMAGEFSFSIALSVAMLGLGVFARGMETGRHRALAAVLIALAALCHGIVVFFVAGGAVLLWLISIDRKRTVYFVTSSVTALLLAAFWFFPFVLTSKFMTDMKYEGAPTPGGEWNSYWKMFFPHTADVDRFWAVLAVIGFVAGIVRRNRVVSFLGVYSLVLIAAVFLAKDGIPGFGLLWNVRLLPFVYLLRYLLAMVGIVELAWGAQRLLHDRRVARRVERAYPGAAGLVLVGSLSPSRASARKFFTSIAVLGVVGASGLGWLSWHLGKFPGQKEVYVASGKTNADKYRFEWLGIDVSTSAKNGFVDGWARHNFTGYVAKGAYGEYRALIETMKGLGADPAHGCGRALWEHTGGEYGTPMALMLLPFWTDSCIGSEEGLFFEASASTPYHFLTSAAMSEKASNPVRGLTYEDRNAELGVRYLQTLGVRYYLAFTPATVARADLQADLIKVATSGPWHVYEVVGSDLVTPLAVRPVVVNPRPGDQRERWLEVGLSYFQHPERWAAVPTADGPADWQRVDVAPDEVVAQPRVDVVHSVQPIRSQPLPAVAVSDVRLGDESISFRVDQVGVPVLVRVSYFPNWQVSGAEGPFRVAPNMMVVVPTSQQVRLTFGRTTIDYGSWAASLLGLFGLVVLWRRGAVVYPDGAPDESYPADPDPFGHDEAFGGDDADVAEAWVPFDELRGRALDDVDLDDAAWLASSSPSTLRLPDPSSFVEAPPPESGG